MNGPYSVLIILLVAMALFIWGHWRYDIVALIALTIGVAVGAVPYEKVYSGLANPAVITVACVMVISQAIQRSGIVSTFIYKIEPITKNTTLHVLSLSFIAALLSAFMNNVGALALMMPIAIQTAIANKRSPSLILMPIALASAMGGLTTLIGTPPNLLVAAYRQKAVGSPFSLFSFGEVGVWVALAGVLFIGLIGWRLMPGRRKKVQSSQDLFQMQDYITEIKVPEQSPIVEKTVSELEELVSVDFLLIGLIRNNKKRLVIPPDYQINADDVLIVQASPSDLQTLLDEAKLELVGSDKISSDALKSNDVSLMEAVVPPGTRIEGRSSRAMRMRSRYHMNLLAIAREGKPFKERLHEVSLKPGDVVLLQGPAESLRENAVNLGFLPLVERNIMVGPNYRKWLAIIIFAVAIVLSAFNIAPVEILFAGAVLFMVLLQAIPARVIYDSIDWPVIILLAAMIPLGAALQSTGGTVLIAHLFTSLSKHADAIWIIGLLLVVTMTLSDFMNNAATTVVMAPIAVSIAQTLHANLDPFLMAVAIGASCSFLTPVGHQNNTLVMGPGGYKFTDYIRIGLPLEVVVVIVALPLIMYVWPPYI